LVQPQSKWQKEKGREEIQRQDFIQNRFEFCPKDTTKEF
jgi:hypothetical protein